MSVAGGEAERAITDAVTINGVTFKNRLLRASVGGRTCNFDGTVTDVWKNFEKRFAEGGVGGIVSTTFHVNERRLSPPQYPSLAADRFIKHLEKRLPEIRRSGCRYIVQIGDPGYATYSSLFPEQEDGLSASPGFDLGLGYANVRKAMTAAQIEQSIAEHAAAARRARAAGADGVEITASKGYLIHQFLNPAINLREDGWGGSPDKRFRFLKEVASAVRAEVGPRYPVGVRLAACDLNDEPLPLALGRIPSPLLSRERRVGNDVDQMVRYAVKLKEWVDYFHVVAGYGFPNPNDVPGAFPFEEIRMFFDSVRHLSRKAAIRAALAHLVPLGAGNRLANIGWGARFEDDGSGISVPLSLRRASRFKSALGKDTRVIVNGGFQELAPVTAAIRQVDMVSMARALIATPNLVRLYLERGKDVPKQRRCSRCNKCVGRTTTSPLGCYDVNRFNGSSRRMFLQILRWNRPDPP